MEKLSRPTKNVNKSVMDLVIDACHIQSIFLLLVTIIK